MQTFVESEAIKLTATYLKNPSLALVTKSQRNVNIRVARPAVLDTVAVKVKPTGLLCACAHEISCYQSTVQTIDLWYKRVVKMLGFEMLQ